MFESHSCLYRLLYDLRVIWVSQEMQARRERLVLLENQVPGGQMDSLVRWAQLGQQDTKDREDQL